MAPSHQSDKIQQDVTEIKDTVKRLEQSLMGTIVNGESTIGLFEQVRGTVKALKK